MENHTEQISNNPKIMRNRALLALEKAKAVEAARIAQGATWQPTHKGYVLIAPKD